tara:strand:+ start:715 stop:951 length:237 start_codon:yes stop_codon:yes gene_type:complete
MSNVNYNIQTLISIQKIIEGIEPTSQGDKEDKKLLEEEVMKDMTSKIKQNVIKNYTDMISKSEIDNFWEPRLSQKESK